MPSNDIAARQAQDGFDDTREVIHLETLAKRRHVSATRWGMMLVIFMRCVAVLWFILGLNYWARIILPGAMPLEGMPTDASVTVVFFAVANLAAAVGLWLAAPWGGVLWLLAALGELAAGWFMPAYFVHGPTVLLLYFTLVVVYIVFTWLAAREREDL